MLEQVLQTISESSLQNNIVVVSRDEDALKICKKFGAKEIFDEKELGVNNAVSLADEYVHKEGFDASVVFPQDIPFMMPQDIDFLLQLQNSSKYVTIVPSRKFDGTNALIRKPATLMKTHYDEDSYKIHLQVGKSMTPNTSLVLVRRIMFDIDDPRDIEFMKTHYENSKLRDEIFQICNPSTF